MKIRILGREVYINPAEFKNDTSFHTASYVVNRNT